MPAHLLFSLNTKKSQSQSQKVNDLVIARITDIAFALLVIYLGTYYTSYYKIYQYRYLGIQYVNIIRCCLMLTTFEALVANFHTVDQLFETNIFAHHFCCVGMCIWSH